jgi:tetratricopeptide (TPR) repeat protein
MGVAAFLIVVISLAQDGHDVLALLLKSRLAQQRGQLELALQLAEQACSQSPPTADSLFQRAEIFMEIFSRGGSLIEEEKLLRMLVEGMERFPRDFRFSGALGRLLFEQPGMARQVQAPNADACLQRSLDQIDPASPELLPDRAETLALLGQIEMVRDPLAASRHFSDALGLMPELEWTWLQAALSLERAGLLRSSRSSYRQFLELADYIPASSQTAVSGALLRLDALLEPGQETLLPLQKFLEEHREETALQWDFIDFFARFGAFSQVRTLLSWMPEPLRQHVQFGIMQVRVLQQQGAYEEALAIALENLERFPHGEPSRHLFSLALDAALLSKQPVPLDRLNNLAHLAGQQDFMRLQWAALQGGREDWFEIETSHPFVLSIRQLGRSAGGSVAHAVLRARLAMAQQNPRVALAFFQQLPRSILNRDPELQLEMADAHALAGQTDQAFKMYQSLLRRNWQSSSLYNNYGYFLLLDGKDLGKARRLIERSLQIDPSCTSCLDSLGWALFLLGETEQAKTYLEKALAADGNDPVKWEHMGDVLAALDRRTEAERFWSQCMTSREERHLSQVFFTLLDKLDPP